MGITQSMFPRAGLYDSEQPCPLNALSGTNETGRFPLESALFFNAVCRYITCWGSSGRLRPRVLPR
jgi:hypothetical protein